MIDLHCHLLPGLDDGARDVDVTLKMARLAVADGIREVVATPHYTEGLFEPSPREVVEAVAKCQELLAGEQIDLRLWPGMEVYLTPGVISLVEEGHLLGLAGISYLLVEFPSEEVPSFAKEVLFYLAAKKMTPVLAHPERNGAIIARPELAYELVRAGSLLQITAGSLRGMFGRRARETAESLLRCRLVHFMASDAHNERRLPKLADALARATALVGEEAAIRLVEENPARVLVGLPVLAEEPSLPKRRKRFF